MTDERIDLLSEPASVARARHFVTRVLHDWGYDGLGDVAALLTSELATNVVLHARTPFAVVVTCTTDGAQVDVLDRSPHRPALQPHDLEATSGRGLALVAALASSWGLTPTSDLGGFTKGVRFRVS
jgi:anti-sigma regulatory factor (Ser/Thr protein kinase)